MQMKYNRRMEGQIMAANALIQTRIDPAVKERASEILDELA